MADLTFYDPKTSPPPDMSPAPDKSTPDVGGASSPDSDVQAYLGKQPQLRSDIDRLLQERGRMVDQGADRIRAQRAQQTALANQPLTPPPQPKFQPIPKPPMNDFQDSLKVFQSPAIAAVLLGSLLTRHPLTAALDAGASAMEAFHKGDKERLELEREKWKESVETAIKDNERIQREYTNAWNDTHLSMQEKLAKMQATAAGAQDEISITAMKTGQMDHLINIWEKRDEAFDKMRESLVRERAKIKLDPAILNDLPHYGGTLSLEDFHGMPLKSQERAKSAKESIENLERVSKFAADHPEAIGMVAAAGVRMNADGIVSELKRRFGDLNFNEASQIGLVKDVDEQMNQRLDRLAKEKNWDAGALANARILHKMLTTQAFTDAAQASSRGATIYLDKVFRDIYKPDMGLEAFFGVLHTRAEEANQVLKPYKMDWNSRDDLDKFPFWKYGAQGYSKLAKENEVRKGAVPNTDNKDFVPAGTIQEGRGGKKYRSKGGFRADPDNWEEIKE